MRRIAVACASMACAAVALAFALRAGPAPARRAAADARSAYEAVAGVSRRASTAIRPCTSAQLHLAPGQRISEPTQQDTRLLALTNVSHTACSLDGYPAVSLLDRRGARLPMRYRDGGDQLLTSRPPQPVTLAPLGRAYEAINKSSCVAGASADAARIRLTLPHARGALTMALARWPSLDYCPAGDPGHVLDISPFEANPDAVLAWYR